MRVQKKTHIYPFNWFLQWQKDNSVGKKIVFSTNGSEETGYLKKKKKTSIFILHYILKFNFRQTADLNIKAEITKFI